MSEGRFINVPGGGRKVIYPDPNLIAYIFSGPCPESLYIGNAIGDGDVNVGDAVYLTACVFKGDPPPVEDCCP
jgi:hypothetical protein